MEKIGELTTSQHPLIANELDLNSFPGSVVVINKQGKMVHANASWNEVLLKNHVLSNSLNNEDYFEIRRRFNQNDTFEAFQGINRILNGADKHFSMSFYCNLEMRHFNMHVHSVQLKDGSLGALISHEVKGKDSPKHAATEHCQKAIFEAFPDGIIVFDFPSGQIKEANQSLCQLLEYTNNEMAQLRFWDLIPPQWRDDEMRVLESKLALYGLTTQQQKVFLTKTKQLRHVTIRYRAIKEQGVTTSAWAIIKDLNQSIEEGKKTLEAQKQQSLGRMANGMAHELNNILSIILANSEMIDLYRFDDDNVFPHTQNIIAATHRASKLLSEISAFNKLNGSDFEELDVFTAVNNALKIVQTALPPNISLSSDLEIRQSTMNGNASQIQQVLLNLAHFVIRALDGRVGRMHIDLQRIGNEKNPQLIALQVGCSHPFIAQEDIDNLNAFYLLEKPHKSSALSTLYYVLHNHKGSISAFETRDWHWVRIELPLKPQPH